MPGDYQEEGADRSILAWRAFHTSENPKDDWWALLGSYAWVDVHNQSYSASIPAWAAIMLRGVEVGAISQETADTYMAAVAGQDVTAPPCPFAPGTEPNGDDDGGGDDENREADS